VHLAEKRRDVWDNWGNVKVLNLLGLTGMTGRNEPLYVVLQHRPPKTPPKVRKSGKNSLMAHCIVSLGDKVEMPFLQNDNRMTSLDISVHEPAIKKKEL